MIILWMAPNRVCTESIWIHSTYILHKHQMALYYNITKRWICSRFLTSPLWLYNCIMFPQITKYYIINEIYFQLKVAKDRKKGDKIINDRQEAHHVITVRNWSLQEPLWFKYIWTHEKWERMLYHRVKTINYIFSILFLSFFKVFLR